MSGLPGSLLVTTIEACSSAVREGVKAARIVQDVLTASVPGQLLVWLKSAPLGPLGSDTTTLVQLAVPMFETAMGRLGVTVVPCDTLPKFMEGGLRLRPQVTDTVALAWEVLALVPAELNALIT